MSTERKYEDTVAGDIQKGLDEGTLVESGGGTPDPDATDDDA